MSTNPVLVYQQLADACARTDYSDRSAVKRHNRSIKQMQAIAQTIGRDGSAEERTAFIALLEEAQEQIRLWAAVHLLEYISVEKTAEERALQLIRRAAQGSTAEALGYRVWLEQWASRTGRDSGS